MFRSTKVEPQTTKQGTARKKWMMWLGAGLFAFSCLVYATFFLMPFVPLSASGKVAMGAAIVAVGETTGWAGTFLLGASIVARLKRYLNPMRWFRGRATAPNDEANRDA